MTTKYKYLIFILLSLLIYVIYKLVKKELFKDKIKSIKEIILILTSLCFLITLTNTYIYDMTYIKAILIFISLSFLYFTYGLINNKEKIYKQNIIFYIILYLILLISITMIIGRANIDFDFKNLKYFNSNSLIPFRSIYRYLTYNVSLKTKLYNIFGNSIMLIPLSFLLMIKDKKYNKILNQTKIILPTILCIEFLQLLTDTGALDIDDIILNFSGVLIFSFLITRFNIIDKIRKLFYKDFNLKKFIKYILFTISLIIPILFIIDTIRICIGLI